MLSTLDDDRERWNGFTRAGDLFFGVTLGRCPDRGVIDAAVSVLRGGLQYVVRGSRLAPGALRDTRAGPIAIEWLEPMRALRLSIAPNPHEIEGELIFRARTEPVAIDGSRSTQFGTWDGWLAIGAERIKLDASHVLGTHARSLGAGAVGERGTSGPAASTRQRFWLSASVHFADLCVHFLVDEDATGNVARSHGAIVPLLGAGQPLEVMASVHHSVQWEKGTRRARAAKLTLVPAQGEPQALELEPIVTFLMRGLDHGDPAWADGMQQAEDVTGGALLRQAELDPMEPSNLHVQQLCRVRMAARVGYGALEQLAIGAHAPSGFRPLPALAG